VSTLETIPKSTRDLTRARPPLHLLPSGLPLLPDSYEEQVRESLSNRFPRGKTIAFDLDETLLARLSSCPESWDPEAVPPEPELLFEKMLPAPRRLSHWFFGGRSHRDNYSRKRYPFLSTEPELTQVRPGFLPLLRALEENENTLLLITASDRYRLQFLNRLLPELFAPFGCRQIPLEDIAAHGSNVPGHSVLEKTPDLATLVGCKPFDLLIDDSPRAARHFRSKGQSDRILSFEPNERPQMVLAEVIEKLTGTRPNCLPATQPRSGLVFLDPCYLATCPDEIAKKL